MSMLWAFERLFWRPEAVETEQRELQVALAQDDEDAAAPPVLICRVCRYEGAEWYCPHCLADTMVRVPRRAR